MAAAAAVVVVVGASIGGVRTAQALRAEGFTGRLVLIGAEPDLPYDKPPLSKQHLAGTWDDDRVRLLTAREAADLRIELALGVPAQRLDVAGATVVLADGSSVAYDVLVVATGASARPSPWRPESGVHVLRSLQDGRRLAADLAGGGPVVVVGGGFIGAEVAATVSASGSQVTVVDPMPVPIGRVVGTEVGELFTGLHARHGVITRFGVGVEDVRGRAGALQVALTDGSVLEAATVLVGIGAVPNDAWLASSGLLIENGVVCDEFCRAVDSADVYAVGDVARWYHPGHGEHIRVEHWTNAVEQAACVAHNIIHPDDLRPYAPVEYVWSDQYDWKIQIVGRPARASEHRIVGHLSGEGARGAALYTDASGVLRGAVSVNWPRALVLCRRLMAAGATADEAGAQLEGLLAPVAVR